MPPDKRRTPSDGTVAPGVAVKWGTSTSGTPGTWIQIRPAAVTADPSSGTISTGYLIWNVTTGHIKRHAGGYVWEVPAV